MRKRLHVFGVLLGVLGFALSALQFVGPQIVEAVGEAGFSGGINMVDSRIRRVGAATVGTDAPQWQQTQAASNITSGTLTVPRGGTGTGSFNAYSLLAGGTTSTGAFQSLADTGNAGDVLVSNGAGSLPTWTENDTPDVQEFTFSKNWIRPANKKITVVFVLGAGAGAGSGRRGASGTNAAGGLGGAPGCSAQGWFLTQSLGATEWVTIGLGGIGGAAVTTDSTSGNPGTAGEGSIFATLRAMGGSAGLGGTTSAGSVAAGVTNSGGIYSFYATSMTGSLNSISGTSQQLSVAMTGTSQIAGPTAGGSGGGISSTNIAYAGAASGKFTGNVPYFTSSPPGGSNTGVNGTAGDAAAYSHMNGGIGGSGGGSNLTGPGGSGGNGHRGGGGGGGGASRNGNNSGAGGNGGNGYCVAISF